MARKVPLHLDALVAIGFLIAAAAAFIAYQRYQYLDLLQENLDRQVKQTQLEFQLARLEAIEKKCAAKVP